MTGVQTCALPIYWRAARRPRVYEPNPVRGGDGYVRPGGNWQRPPAAALAGAHLVRGQGEMKPQSLFALCFALMMPGACSAAATERGPEASSSLRLVSRSLTPNAPGCYNALYLPQPGACLRSGEGVSTDNGRTWKTEPMLPDFVSGLPRGYRRNPITSALDPFTGRLITILNALDRSEEH